LLAAGLLSYYLARPMVEGAALLFSGQEEGNHAGGDSLAKEDRLLAAQRFRQVDPATADCEM